MPNRNYNANNYRYGFNGKENDKSINEGAQDYGMRIYDKRLGRFFSLDAFKSLYPSRSPYSFGGNSPIRFADFDGNGDDDRIIASKISGKKQVMIQVIDDSQINDFKKIANLTNYFSTEWDFIIVTDLRAAKNIIVENYEKKGIKLDKMFLGTHSGSSAEDDGEMHHGLFLPVNNTTNNKTTKNFVTITDYKLNNTDLENKSDESEQIKALSEIFKSLNYDATLIFSACSMGGDGGDPFWDALVEKTIKNVRLTLLSNVGQTNRSVYSNFGWDKDLTTKDTFRGWSVKLYHNSQLFKNTKVLLDLRLKSNGTYYFSKPNISNVNSGTEDLGTGTYQNARFLD